MNSIDVLLITHGKSFRVLSCSHVVASASTRFVMLSYANYLLAPAPEEKN